MDPSQASARDVGSRQALEHAHHPDGASSIPLVAVRASPIGGGELVERIWEQGAAVLPLDASLTDREARASAAALGATALLDDAGRRSILVPQRGDSRGGVGGDGSGKRGGGSGGAPAGTALVVHTSGTTGPPRGVVLGHDALRAGIDASVDRLDAHAARWLGVLPLHHVAGLLVTLRARAAGTAAVQLPRFDLEAVANAVDDGIATHIAVVPTMLHRMLDHGVDVARFERILVGGAMASRELLERAADAGARVTVSYGMTETCGGCVYDGIPLDGVAVAVDTDDRVLLRGPMLADGYLTDGHVEPVVDADGWLRTDDIGRFVDGRLTVTGRSDDVVVTGGVNVSSTAITDLVRSHPSVRDAAVVGLHDAEWGQRVVAVVVPVDHRRPPTEHHIRAHVRARAPAAMVPRQVTVVAMLPRTPLGKIDRTAVRSQIERADP